MQNKILKFLGTKNKISFKLKKKWFSSINNLNDNTICFLSDLADENISKINKKKNLVLLIKEKNSKIKKNIIQIETFDPKLFFFEILKKFYSPKIENRRPIIGKNTKISKNVYIGKNVIIGNNTVIFSNVVINDNVQIGSNCVVKSGSVIGQKGFQAIRDEKKNLVEIYHVGNVVMKDFVDIGA